MCRSSVRQWAVGLSAMGLLSGGALVSRYASRPRRLGYNGNPSWNTVRETPVFTFFTDQTERFPKCPTSFYTWTILWINFWVVDFEQLPGVVITLTVLKFSFTYYREVPLLFWAIASLDIYLVLNRFQHLFKTPWQIMDRRLCQNFAQHSFGRRNQKSAIGTGDSQCGPTLRVSQRRVLQGLRRFWSGAWQSGGSALTRWAGSISLVRLSGLAERLGSALVSLGTLSWIFCGGFKRGYIMLELQWKKWMEMALLPANWEINQPRLMLMMLVAGFDMVAAVIFLIFFGIGGLNGSATHQFPLEVNDGPLKTNWVCWACLEVAVYIPVMAALNNPQFLSHTSLCFGCCVG